MENISFQSRIRVVGNKTFNKCVKKTKGNFVDYPWTIADSKLAQDAITTKVYDCSVLGISDGHQVLLMHLCPTISANLNYQAIENYVKSKINLKNPNLQGLILGSKNNNVNSPNSPLLFEYLKSLLEKFKIPYSEFRGGDFTNNVAYRSSKDEWLIGNNLLDIVTKDVFKTPKAFLDRVFDSYKIAKQDYVSW